MQKIKRRAGILSAVMILAGATTVALTSTPANATTGDCDGTAVIGRFRAVESGASFSFNGRRVELQNESALDVYSRAEIKSGRKSGDQVWVDRSYRSYPASVKGIVDSSTAESQGWKQCGPFSEFRTQSVYNDYYAARACARMDGVSVCGKWYVD